MELPIYFLNVENLLDAEGYQALCAKYKDNVYIVDVRFDIGLCSAKKKHLLDAIKYLNTLECYKEAKISPKAIYKTLS